MNIYFIDNHGSYDCDSDLDNGCGASEQQFYNLIKYISNFCTGKITCFNKVTETKIHRNIIYTNIDNIKTHEFEKNSIIIVSRFYCYSYRSYIDKFKTFIWIHDLFWYHIYTGNYEGQPKWSNMNVRNFFKNSKNIHFICNSKHCKNKMLEANTKLGISISNDRIHIIYNNLYKTSNITSIRDGNIGRNINKIIFASAYKSKGGREIVNIFNKLLKLNSSLELHLFTPNYNSIDTTLSNLKNVFVYNSVKKEKLYEHIKSASCVLTPCVVEETFGCLFAEALYLNTPVLIDRRSGAVKELVEELKPSDQHLCDFDNINELFEHIRFLREDYKYVEKTIYLGKRYIDEPLEKWKQLLHI